FLILFGTAMTVVFSIMLSNEWNKKDVQKQAHIIPDKLKIDLDTEITLSDTLKNSILNQVLQKTKEDGNDITLSPFFDRKLIETLPKLYKLDSDIYESIIDFELSGNLKSKDGETALQIYSEE